MGGGAIAMLVVVTTYASEVVEGKTITAKPLLAGGVLGLMLTIVESISPRVGHAFGVLIIVAALATNGADALKALGMVSNPTTTDPSTNTGTNPTSGQSGAKILQLQRPVRVTPIPKGTGVTGPIVTG